MVTGHFVIFNIRISFDPEFPYPCIDFWTCIEKVVSIGRYSKLKYRNLYHKGKKWYWNISNITLTHVARLTCLNVSMKQLVKSCSSD